MVRPQLDFIKGLEQFFLGRKLLSFKRRGGLFERLLLEDLVYFLQQIAIGLLAFLSHWERVDHVLGRVLVEGVNISFAVEALFVID